MKQNQRTRYRRAEAYGTTVEGTAYIWAVRPYRLDLPFEFSLPRGDYSAEYWADRMGVTSACLRRDTESLISNCHSAALLLAKAEGRQPEIYLLGLGSLAVIYTVETEAVVVRGYIRNLPYDQTDEVLAFSYLVDWDWHLSPGDL